MANLQIYYNSTTYKTIEYTPPYTHITKEKLKALFNRAEDITTIYGVKGAPSNRDRAATDVISVIDYGGLTITGSDVYLGRAKVVKNLIIDRQSGSGSLSLGSECLQEFYGDIKIKGNGTGKVELFSSFGNITPLISCPIYKAVGELKIENIKELDICHGLTSSENNRLWFNVMDLRNVDTSTCTSIMLLSQYDGECTFIFGNFSNENVTSIGSLFMLQSAKKDYQDNYIQRYEDRIAVMTTAVPPKFNTSSATDWIKRGKIGKILVPEDYYEAYINNVYNSSDTVGQSGWSYYGPYSVKEENRNMLGTYNPATQYTIKREGDSPNGRKMWLYRE